MKMQTSIRVDDKFYKDSKEIFGKMGLTFAEGINIFLAKVSTEKKIPFELSSEPSLELENRIRNINGSENIKSFKNSNDLFEDLGI